MEIWRDLPGVQDVLLDDDFFALGGYSLKALKLTHLVQTRLAVALPYSAVFATPTMRGLAQRILDGARYGHDALDEPLVTLERRPGGRPLFAFPPGTGDALSYAQLSGQLDCEFHAFNFIEADNRMDEYARLITGIEPQGPYLLLGYSGGGNLAFHVAKRLERAGCTVAGVVMLDSSRVMNSFRFPHGEADRLADEFLGARAVKDYVPSAVLRDKTRRMIRRYLEVLSAAPDSGAIEAPIHLVVCEGSQDLSHEPDGRLLASKSAWSHATRGVSSVRQGTGPHAHMLNEPHLAANAALLRAICDAIPA